MRIECPACGKKGSVPDGLDLSIMVRCTGCNKKFAPAATVKEYTLAGSAPQAAPPIKTEIVRTTKTPVSRAPSPDRLLRPLAPIEARVIEVAPSPPAPSRTCEYCGESIQPTAKKCRYCGEILDLSLRTAEEAKRIALRSSASSPIVINNSNAASASATAVAVGGRRRGFFSRLVRLVGVACLLMLVGFVLIGTAPDSGGPRTIIGGIVALVGVAMLIVGLPLMLIGGLWRALFG
jgi:hypothetical protein